MKMRLMEAQHREELIQLSRRHDEKVKVLLERKGDEMRELTGEQERVCSKKDGEIDKLEEKIHEVIEVLDK